MRYLILILLALSASVSAAHIDWSDVVIGGDPHNDTVYRLSGVTESGVQFKKVTLRHSSFMGYWGLGVGSELNGKPHSEMYSVKGGEKNNGVTKKEFNDVIKFIKLEAAKKHMDFRSISISSGYVAEIKEAYSDVLLKTQCSYKDDRKKFGFCVDSEIEKELHRRGLIEGICVAMGGSTNNCSWESEYPIIFKMNEKGKGLQNKDNVDWNRSYFYISINKP